MIFLIESCKLYNSNECLVHFSLENVLIVIADLESICFQFQMLNETAISVILEP